MMGNIKICCMILVFNLSFAPLYCELKSYLSRNNNLDYLIFKYDIKKIFPILCLYLNCQSWIMIQKILLHQNLKDNFIYFYVKFLSFPTYPHKKKYYKLLTYLIFLIPKFVNCLENILFSFLLLPPPTLQRKDWNKTGFISYSPDYPPLNSRVKIKQVWISFLL